jgi:hypothetical protein
MMLYCCNACLTLLLSHAYARMCVYVQEAMLNGSPLRQHQSSSRGQGSNRPGSAAAAADRSSTVYTRMIRMAAAIQQVSTPADISPGNDVHSNRQRKHAAVNSLGPVKLLQFCWP